MAMPGVFRPYTLVDVLGTLNQQIAQQQGGSVSVNGFGDFAEIDETSVYTDSVTTSVQVNPTWDNGTWGGISWG